VLLTHPDRPTDPWWLTIHVVLLPLFGLSGLSVGLLVDGLGGTIPLLARAGAAVFVFFYNAGDAVAGISSGLLARRGAGPQALDPLFSDPVKGLLFDVGLYGWAAALLLAAVALAAAEDRPPAPAVLLLPAAILPRLGDHSDVLFGPVPFALLFLAAAWVEVARHRRLRTPPRPGP
jgi:hypothetical protein